MEKNIWKPKALEKHTCVCRKGLVAIQSSVMDVTEVDVMEVVALKVN